MESIGYKLPFDRNAIFSQTLSGAKDRPRLILADETSKTRVALDVSKDGPRLAMADEDGKTIWSQP